MYPRAMSMCTPCYAMKMRKMMSRHPCVCAIHPELCYKNEENEAPMCTPELCYENEAPMCVAMPMRHVYADAMK